MPSGMNRPVFLYFTLFQRTHLGSHFFRQDKGNFPSPFFKCIGQRLGQEVGDPGLISCLPKELQAHTIISQERS